jgi:uncharacterized protein YdaL
MPASLVKIIRPLLIVAAAACIWITAAPRALGAAQPQAFAGDAVLLVYDSLAKDTAKKEETDAVARLLMSLGAKVRVEPVSGYQPGTLASYQRLLLLCLEPSLKLNSPELVQELEGFTGSMLQLGGPPMAHAGERPTRQYGPTPQAGAGGRLVTARLLREWMGVPGHGQLYVLIRGFTPFSDYTLLRGLADELYAGGIPFVVGARPVMDNLQFPAAKRYAAVLRYIQQKQGAVLMEAPAVFGPPAEGKDPLHQQISSFLDMMIQEGAAPLGIAAEQYWSFDRHYREEGMPFFDSLVLYANRTNLPVYQARTTEAEYFQSTLYSISLDNPDEWEMLRESASNYPVDTAVTLDFPESKKELDALVKTLKAYPAVFADYREREHTTRTASHMASALGGKVLIDGSPLALETRDADDAQEEDFTYIEREKASFTGFFQAQNQIFLAVVVSALAVFTLFIAAGRRLYRRKFLK